MPGPRLLLRRARDRFLLAASAFGRALHAPVRRPRITTRRLMMLVCLVAVALWLWTQWPRLVDYRDRGDLLEVQADDFRERERQQLAESNAIQAELERFRRDTSGTDGLSEQFFLGRRDRALSNARFYHETAAYYARLGRAYHRASWMPWQIQPRDPTPPPDPYRPVLETIRPGQVVELVSDAVVSLAFSSDGSRVALGCRDRTVRVLELASRRMLATFPASSQFPLAGSFSPDGTTLAVVDTPSSIRPSIRLWNVANGRLVKELKVSVPVAGPVAWSWTGAVRYAPDGKSLVASVSWLLEGPERISGNAVESLDATTGQLRWEHSLPADVIDPVFLPGGESLALVGPETEILDARTGAPKTRLYPITGAYDLVLLRSKTGEVALPKRGENLFVVAEVKGKLWFRIFISNSHNILDIGESDLTVETGRIGALRAQLEGLWPPHGLTRPEKDRVMAAVATVVRLAQISPIAAAALPADGGLLTVVDSNPSPAFGPRAGISVVHATGADGIAREWGIEESVLPRGPRRVTVSPDGKRIAAVGNGASLSAFDPLAGRVNKFASELRIWDVASGRTIAAFQGGVADQLALAFAPDGRSLVFADSEHVYWIDAGTGSLKHVLLDTSSHLDIRDPPGTPIPASAGGG